MKQIFTLLAAVIAALNSFAQISEGFNSETEVNTLKNSCWSISGFTFSGQNPIEGVGSIQSDNRVAAQITTPWLQVPANFSVTISYRIISTTNNGANKFKISLWDNTVETLLLNTNLNSNGIETKTFQFSGSNNTGIKKLVIAFPSTAVVQIDALRITVPYYYAGKCNSAPVAQPDFYYPGFKTEEVKGNVLTNDTDADFEAHGEKAVSARLVSAPIEGLVFNPDGSFTYTPPTTGTFGEITFEYAATDNGYDPKESNTTKVTLEYPENTLLPVKLVSFAGKIANEKAQLTWAVADNENAQYFEIEHSTDGVHFSNSGLVFAGAQSGAATYTFAAALKPEQKQYFRLKLWDKEGAFEYSNVILLQTGATATQALKVWQPSASLLSLQFSTAKAQNLQLTLVNLSGMVLQQQTVKSTAGTNLLNIDLKQQLKPGVYLVQLRNEAAIFSGKLLVP